MLRLKLSITRTLLAGTARMIRLQGLYHVVRLFALCEYACDFRRRKRFYRELKRLLGSAYDHASARHACRSYFTRVRCDKVYYLIFDLLPQHQIMERIHTSGREQLDHSLARNKGAYYALCHLGAQHVAGLIMSFMGYQVAGVRDPNESALRKYIQKKYENRFAELRATKILHTNTLPRDIYRCFKDNYLVGSALDVKSIKFPHLKTAQVTLFGETHQFLTGTVQIAIRCKAAIHQGFVISHPGFRYELTGTAPLVDPESAEDTPETVQHIMQAYASNIEQFVRAHPDHLSRL